MASPSFTPNLSCGPCLYCGQVSDGRPDELVACELCRRPLHLSCLKNGSPDTTLLGDNFFMATCSACSSSGQDSVIRANMNTVQLLLLVMYNLHSTQLHSSRSGFFHWKIHVYQFISQHWKQIYGPYSRHKKKKVVQRSLSGQLSHYSQYFTSGQTVLGEGGWYRLTLQLPPAQAIQQHVATKTNWTGRVGQMGLSGAEGSGVFIKQESHESEDSLEGTPSSHTSSLGSWFTERGLHPESLPPQNIFGDQKQEEQEEEEEEDDEEEEEVRGVTHFSMRLDDVKHEIIVKEEALNSDFEEEEGMLEEEAINVECDGREGDKSTTSNTKSHTLLQPPVSLFPAHSPLLSVPRSSSDGDRSTHASMRRLSSYEEKQLLARLEQLHSAGQLLSPRLLRLRRKLAVRSLKQEHGLPVFTLGEVVEHWRLCGRLRTRREWGRAQREAATAHLPPRVLDRFQVCGRTSKLTQHHNMSFASRLSGPSDGGAPTFIHSPYTLRYLKPYIMRDHDCAPLKLRLLWEVEAHHHRDEEGWKQPPRAPIDYCYVAPRHIPAMNQLAKQFFWPGIDLSEVLQYPDHTCVVLYRHLVVGFGVLVPDTGYNVAYLSFLLVHPEWRRAGIATFLLYHLIQSCMGKDVTLHVSATNPALILYQRFGFKVEEFLSNFYDKYLPADSPECKHAMFLRLSR